MRHNVPNLQREWVLDMGSFWDELKLALRDQAVGTAKYGASTSISHNAAALKAARAERLENEARRSQSARTERLAEEGPRAQAAQQLGVTATRAAQTSRQYFEYLKSSGQIGKATILMEDDSYKVTAKRGYSMNKNCYTVDMIIVDKAVKDMHIHAVYNAETDEMIMCQWNANHK